MRLRQPYLENLTKLRLPDVPRGPPQHKRQGQAQFKMVSSRMPKRAQASPVFSVLLGVLCVEFLLSLKPGKLLTQRTQRGTEKNEPGGGQGCFHCRSK